MGLQKNISRKRTREAFFGEKPSRIKSKRRNHNPKGEARREKFDNWY